MTTTLCGSEGETEGVARSIAERVRDGGVVALEGELGAGKTRFVRGLVRALGGDPRRVSSPTFALVQDYPIAGGKRLWHLDAYRVSGPGELEAIGFDELLEATAEGDVVAIEWASRVIDLLPADAVRVMIEHVDEATRRITLPR